MAKKALLMILDGWGIGNKGKGDVIFNTPTPYMDRLQAEYPNSQLLASGENVGLPDGQMGNSEVGHLNIGGGRIVYQDLVKINRACADNSIMQNKEIVAEYKQKKGDKGDFITIYCYSEDERINAIKDLGPDPEITRFKGLGEISPEEFANFIGEEMRLEQVKLQKSDKVAELMEYYMGKNTMERQNFIIDNLVIEEDRPDEEVEI